MSDAREWSGDVTIDGKSVEMRRTAGEWQTWTGGTRDRGDFVEPTVSEMYAAADALLDEIAALERDLAAEREAHNRERAESVLRDNNSNINMQEKQVNGHQTEGNRRR